ncbi:hypothetical protein N1851_030606 [Merluccius polli]|uniref:Uncharacterized protein n=1 Tax=Merluccius polli TaxID=89951 RepID=A0AA47NQR3_MERPO|nr:hypothetical protein N1851_030606 [Merluccius polli]
MAPQPTGSGTNHQNHRTEHQGCLGYTKPSYEETKRDVLDPLERINKTQHTLQRKLECYLALTQAGLTPVKLCDSQAVIACCQGVTPCFQSSGPCWRGTETHQTPGATRSHAEPCGACVTSALCPGGPSTGALASGFAAGVWGFSHLVKFHKSAGPPRSEYSKGKSVNKATSSKLTNAIAKWIAVDCSPSTLLKTRGFKTLSR